MAVQWKVIRWPVPYSMTPRPLGSSNSATSPTSGVRPTDTSPAGPLQMVDSVVIGQWTILARASSMMSVAPRSFRAGMSTLISDLGTTVSTAKPPPPNSSETVGELERGQDLDDPGAAARRARSA